MLSIDTLRIRCDADLSRSNEFEERGMKQTYRLPHWHKNIWINDACFLKIDASKVGRKDYVTVEFSAQKHQNRNHVSPFNFSLAANLLDEISASVEEKTGIEIDAASGTVTRCDFNYNWKLESELEVCSWLDVLRNAKYPNLKRMPFEDTTVYFRSSAYAKNIYCGRPQGEPIHEALFYAKSPQVREMVERKQISKQDLLEVQDTLRIEERLRSEDKIKHELKRHGFASAMTKPKPMTVMSADFAEEVIMKTYKDLHLEKDVLGKNEREVELLRYFAPNGKIEDRTARENFKRLYLTMKLADGIGGDNLLPLGILTESVFYRNKSELYDLGLWSSNPQKGKEKRQILKGLSKPMMRRCAE